MLAIAMCLAGGHAAGALSIATVSIEIIIVFSQALNNMMKVLEAANSSIDNGRVASYMMCS